MGYLGSRNDEERSEMRYVMQIAGIAVNHQTSERKLRFRVSLGVCLYEVRLTPLTSPRLVSNAELGEMWTLRCPGDALQTIFYVSLEMWSRVKEIKLI